MKRGEPRKTGPALLFDLDGTLLDSVYQHVLAWREALEKAGIELAVWRIHRRIGMSGGLFVNALLRETGRRVTADDAARLQRLHEEAYLREVKQVRPLPGARELLAYLGNFPDEVPKIRLMRKLPVVILHLVLQLLHLHQQQRQMQRLVLVLLHIPCLRLNLPVQRIQPSLGRKISRHHE